jgi:GLPGLI family protein
MHLQRTVLVIVLELFSYYTAFGQTHNMATRPNRVDYRAVYQLDYRPDSTNTSRKTDNMNLDINSFASCFYNVVAAQEDSLINTLTMSSTHQDIQDLFDRIGTIPRPQNTYLIYKRYAEGRNLYIEEISNKYYEQTTKITDLKWKILSADTATVSGYPCQKATTSYAGRFYTAWFTRQLPFADGPYKFSGLPGLIIDISDARQDYHFKLTTFQKFSAVNQIVLPAYPTLTIPATVREIYAGQIKELYQIANNQTGYNVPNSPQQRQSLLSKIKNRNNPIELK